MSTLHSGWHNERISLLGTLGTPQFVVLGLGLLPALFFLQAQAWILFAVALLSWLLLFAVVALPIRERPAWLWIADGLMHMIGKSTRADQYTAKAVGSGLSSEEATQFDLPGGLQGFEVFDGPTHAPSDMRRLCVLKDPEGGWVMVARLEHPGLSLTDPDAGDRWASALGDMLSAVARGEQLPHRVSLYVRTVPDDGAERAAWRRTNSPTDVPEQVARDAEAVEASVLSQSISHEVYCAIRFRDEALVAGASRSTRRTLDSRIAAMYRALPEVTGLLTSAGCEQVTWLSKGEVAAAVRTGFNPAAAQSIQVARAAKALGFEAFDEVQPAAAGPSAAPSPHARYYDHDGFRSAAYSLILPEMGTQVGSLGPLLTPGQPGERRSLALHYEPFDDKEASKAAEAQSTNAFLQSEMKAKRGFRVSAKTRKLRQVTASQEEILARGHTLTRMTGVAVVTVPASMPIETHLALMEASARRRKFELMRLDLAQPLGFVSGVLPFAVGMPKRRGAK